MLAVKALALISAGGISIAQSPLIEDGSKLGSLGSQAIMGIVCLACVYALVKIYKDKEKSQKEYTERFFDVMEKNAAAAQEHTKAAQQHADNAAAVAGVLVELKKEVMNCSK